MSADAMETDMDPATYEELAQLEMEFDDIDTEIMAKQWILSKPTYAKRNELISRIPNFWPLVMELAPPEIDSYIQPSDSQILSTALKNIEVTRFETPASLPAAPKSLAEYGEPRSVAITFEFAENEWFSDKSLTKKFWYRRASDGYIGLVSEPVKINWKAGKDLTDGMLDMAVQLWQEQKKAGVEWDAAKGQGAPTFAALKAKVDKAPEGALSFFTWFGYRGRYIGPNEHAEATKKADEKRARVKRGETVEEEEEDEDDDDIDLPELHVEICQDGDDIAIAIAEDLWPSAIRYFTEAQEADDLDSADFEDDEDDIDEDDDEDEDMQDAPPAARRGKAGRPAKK